MMLKTWLESLGMNNVIRCSVTLTNGKQKRVEMIGCIYYNPQHKREYIYCLGDYNDLPIKSTLRTSVFYVTDKDYFLHNCYYVASYSTENCLTGKFKEFHPFGHSVIMVKSSPDFVQSTIDYANARSLVKFGDMILK